MTIDYDKIGGVQIQLKGDTSIGLVLRSLYENFLYFSKKEKSIKKASAYIYYTTKTDLKIKDNLKIFGKHLEIDELLKSLIKQINDNKTLDSDSVINSKIYLNLFDNDGNRFVIYNKDENIILAEIFDKFKTNKHIEVKPIKDKKNVKAYVFSKDLDIEFIKKPSTEVFEYLDNQLTNYKIYSIDAFKKIMEQPEEIVEETVEEEIEEVEENDDLPFDASDFVPVKAEEEVEEKEDDDDPLSGDLDDDDFTRN